MKKLLILFVLLLPAFCFGQLIRYQDAAKTYAYYNIHSTVYIDSLGNKGNLTLESATFMVDNNTYKIASAEQHNDNNNFYWQILTLTDGTTALVQRSSNYGLMEVDFKNKRYTIR